MSSSLCRVKIAADSRVDGGDCTSKQGTRRCPDRSSEAESCKHQTPRWLDRDIGTDHTKARWPGEGHAQSGDGPKDTEGNVRLCGQMERKQTAIHTLDVPGWRRRRR